MTVSKESTILMGALGLMAIAWLMMDERMHNLSERLGRVEGKQARDNHEINQSEDDFMVSAEESIDFLGKLLGLASKFIST